MFDLERLQAQSVVGASLEVAVDIDLLFRGRGPKTDARRIVPSVTAPQSAASPRIESETVKRFV
jgi:hypothetical protein